ncbi:hypothetical protein LTR36_000741 [Oleoguttula mirabilis]|uniref:SET domain-containing protein n=1 Tax=Oleoguttula mirabilis TaxID=1507867 RepID=A0AAV9JRE6_9PEZI|nr:hypothetical protein LTR36_000741 [Oleoguttula mirabilis]
MDNMADAVELTGPTYHELTINFPAVELLPAGTRPYLHSPKDLEYREKPTVEAYQPQWDDVDFFQCIEVDRGRDRVSQASDYSEQSSFLSAVARLRGAAGRSTLDVVAWRIGDDHNAFMCIVRLSTTWESTTGEVMECMQTSFDAEEWIDELAVGSGEPWVVLLKGLMERASVRAYFHVVNNLLRYDREFAMQEDAQWDSRWGILPLPTRRATLCQKLQCLGRDGNGGVVSLPITDIDSHAPNDRLWILLPCGHSHEVEASALQQVTARQCMTFACVECGHAALDQADRDLVVLDQGRERRVSSIQRQSTIWTLDKVRENDGVTTVTATALLEGLETGLRSFETPKSVTPRALRPSAFPEVIAVMAAFRQDLGMDGAAEIALTPREMYDLLKALADSTLEGSADGSMSTRAVSPRYERMYCKWLARATRYAMSTMREASKKEVAGMAELMDGMML